MKKYQLVILLLLFPLTSVFSQDYTNITFRHIPSTSNVVRAFVPGSFNGWGPNDNGKIYAGAPSQMTYVDSLECYIKTIRLKIGDTHNYKFHEHYNSSGSQWQWFTDPFNTLIDTLDNNNSILNIEKTMIFQIFPRMNSTITEDSTTLVAGVFVAEKDSILLDQSTIYLNNSLLSTFEGNVNEDFSILSYQLHQLNIGDHKIVINVVTENGESKSDSSSFTRLSLSVEDLPEGVIDGINYVDNSTVTLSLLGPDKKFVYVIGDFNNWQSHPNYLMNITPDSSRFWLTITDLIPGEEYLFQYFIDEKLKIADPYCEKISSPWHDHEISEATYPNLISYPTGKTTESASVLQTAQQPYQWEVTGFERPKPKDLMIYELLIRDFIEAHNYQTLIDTLSYLQRLGINAIELMPVNEFEGNISWGYNPSFYFAADKYYGPKNDLKRFIDECHKRKIAVIIDMVLNHSFGQSPLVRSYSSGNYGPPSSENPWYNVSATHPYSVGYDFNHESIYTKELVDRVNKFWLIEYNVDGFRFDLSKGFTQRFSGNDVGLWGKYDASRIAILKRMADQIWTVDSTTYIILEHFAENREEKELVEYKNGMLIWGNLNIAYSQSAMGWLEDSQRSSDLSWGFFKNRNWQKPHLVTYMDSHDEPWLMYKNLKHGRSSTGYNIKDISTGLDRIKLAAAFFLTLPGPKMIWQFGELGYDQYLPDSGYERTNPKPILWNYYNERQRKTLFNTYASLIKLRNEYEIFRSPQTNVQMRVGQGQYDRRLNLSLDSIDVTIIGNFHVDTFSVNPDFQHSGTWYDFFTGDSIQVIENQALIELCPGEFHIYSSIKLPVPVGGYITSVDEKFSTIVDDYKLFQNYPNPFNSETIITFELSYESDVKIEIFNLYGQKIKLFVFDKQSAGAHRLIWNGNTEEGHQVGNGLYIYRFMADDFIKKGKMTLIR